MKVPKTLIFLCIINFSCGNGVDRHIDLARKIIKANGLINLCIKQGSYMADTLYLTEYDSLDKETYVGLIFEENGKLSISKVDIFPGTSIGIDPKSDWTLSDKNGLLTLNIIEYGIDDHTHFTAEYKIERYTKGNVILVRTKTILNE